MVAKSMSSAWTILGSLLGDGDTFPDHHHATQRLPPIDPFAKVAEEDDSRVGCDLIAHHPAS